MKKKTIIIIVTAVVLVAAAVVGGILIAKKLVEKQYQTVEMETIKIPGFTEIEVQKDTTDVSIYLENPEGNPCSFVYEIIFNEGGDVLYTSPSIAPGESINDIKLAVALPEGRYPVTIKVTTTSVTDGKPMNGATIESVIVAK